MLVTFDGRMGQGKTAAATALAVWEHKSKGVKLFTTYHLNDVVICPHCPAIRLGDKFLPLRHPIHSENGGIYYYCEHKGEIQTVLKENTVEKISYKYLDLEGFYELFKEAEDGTKTLSNCIFVLDEAYLFMDARHSGSKINRLFNAFTFQTRKRGVDMYITSHDVSRLDKRIRAATDLKVSCRYNSHSQVITLRIRDMHTGERRRMHLYGPVAAFPYFDTSEIVVPKGKIFKLNQEDLQ